MTTEKRYIFLLDDFSVLLSEFPSDIDNDDQFVGVFAISKDSEIVIEAILTKLVAMALERTIDIPTIRQLDGTLN